ncbi:transcriptional regulator [Duganella sp. LX20W]|uniref:Transcriptional regulator n=1 Tax=Rugamonas brunnea TaxID=2758569 RepID=A0A7W2EPU9_9BURK|nr:DUF6516 family protein [Rugamonas brunnea]MBA5636445.1 transcriptional regulator [Rugamonas brunnea]
MTDKKIIDETCSITKKRGNGQLRREVWVDSCGRVTRYNLAYINHRVFQRDNGRVVGYDNAHGNGHHRHYMGLVEPVSYTNFDDVEARFRRDWTAFLEHK